MQNSLQFIIFCSIFSDSNTYLLNIDPDNFRNSVCFLDLYPKDLTYTQLINQSQLIESRGFGSETHKVITKDGYFLTIYRIINPFVNRTNIRPLIVWHGITHNSDSWLTSIEGMLQKNGVYMENNNLVNDCQLSVTSNLPFTLSACGYDVWLSNTRGTDYYSVNSEHLIFNASQGSEYWEYTFTELGVYDAKAVVQYILEKTKKDYVGYIGFSMGSTIMFILLSLEPEFETFVKPFIALAPFVYMSHMRSTLRSVTQFEPYLRSSARPLGVPRSIAQFIGIFICGNQYFNQMCEDTIFQSSGGYDTKNFNASRIPIFISHTGNTYSTWVYAQVAQIIQSGTFSSFNYGTRKNMEVYGQSNPPNYPLNRIKSRNMALIYGLNDIVANITDVQMLIKQLQVPLLDNYLVPYGLWNHQDNQWGNHQGYYINSRILRLLKLFV